MPRQIPGYETGSRARCKLGSARFPLPGADAAADIIAIPRCLLSRRRVVASNPARRPHLGPVGHPAIVGVDALAIVGVGDRRRRRSSDWVVGVGQSLVGGPSDRCGRVRWDVSNGSRPAVDSRYR